MLTEGVRQNVYAIVKIYFMYWRDKFICKNVLLEFFCSAPPWHENWPHLETKGLKNTAWRGDS